MQHASHDFVLFMDDDMLLSSWRVVDVLVSQMLAGDYDAALFPRRNYAIFPQLYDDHRLTALIADWRSRDFAFDLEQLYDPVVHGAAYKTMAFCFPGCFMLIRRDAYDAVGGFPEDFTGWGPLDSAWNVTPLSPVEDGDVLFWHYNDGDASSRLLKRSLQRPEIVRVATHDLSRHWPLCVERFLALYESTRDMPACKPLF